MADVVLFHHVQGLTDGVLELAERLRGGRHVVHTPDLFHGVRPATLEEGMEHVHGIDDAELEARAAEAVADLPDRLVVAGVSIGVMFAQRLAVSRPGVRGALLYEACLPLQGEWGVGPWPPRVPVQVHGMDADPFFALEGDVDAARELVATVDDGELFTYAGDRHLFVDSSLPSYDADATALVVERSLGLLDRLSENPG
jgi:dienelactone hydrolase